MVKVEINTLSGNKVKVDGTWAFFRLVQEDAAFRSSKTWRRFSHWPHQLIEILLEDEKRITDPEIYTQTPYETTYMWKSEGYISGVPVVRRTYLSEDPSAPNPRIFHQYYASIKLYIGDELVFDQDKIAEAHWWKTIAKFSGHLTKRATELDIARTHGHMARVLSNILNQEKQSFQIYLLWEEDFDRTDRGNYVTKFPDGKVKFSSITKKGYYRVTKDCGKYEFIELVEEA